MFSIQLWYKKLFLLFLVNGLGEERERSSDSSGKERKMSLTQISVTKTVDLCVKWFHLMMRVHISFYFFLLWKCLKNIYELEKIFCFGFWNGFLRSWTSLLRFLWCFLSVLFQKWAGKWVLGKKTFKPNFLTTTIARI
jgi:hypothetical protein